MTAVEPQLRSDRSTLACTTIITLRKFAKSRRHTFGNLDMRQSSFDFYRLHRRNHRPIMFNTFVIRSAWPSLLVESPVFSPFHVVSLLLETMAYHLRTLFLFTYSDYKTILIPITIFSCMAAPVYSATHFLQGIAWIWLHLLQCNVSNQYKSCAEDAINRPWRPLPSGRVTLEQATVLRWALVALCLTISFVFGWDTAIISLALTTTMVVYDEVGLAGHWLGKNVCNISGYVTFEMGATKIMGRTSHLDTTASISVVLSAFIIFTTIQMQDFPDVQGDLALGRITLPIHFPRASRVLTSIGMMFWSIVLVFVWQLTLLPACLMLAIGAWIAYRVYAYRTVAEDKQTYILYNLWLATAHCLPANVRW